MSERADRRTHRKKHYGLKIAAAAALIVCAIIVTHLDFFDVNGIAVVENEDISDEEIIHLSGIEIGESIFDVHPLIVEHKIKKNLYISDVEVDRKFPNKVEIRVSEKSCNAQIPMGKSYAIIDSDGCVIEVSNERREESIIKGVTVTKAKPGKDIKVEEEATFQQSMKLLKITERNDLFFKKVLVEGNDVSAWIYGKLKCKGKYDNVISSIRSGTLKTIIYDLYQKGKNKGTITVNADDYCYFTP